MAKTELLADCMAFPEVVPYVRSEDGIRRHLRCTICRNAEYPQDEQNFWMCDDCLKRVIEAIRSRTPIDQIILFRTYNPGARCNHANADTVLAQDPCIDAIFGKCEQCFQEERNRRAQQTRPRIIPR